jgi:hypothetical protein
MKQKNHLIFRMFSIVLAASAALSATGCVQDGGTSGSNNGSSGSTSESSSSTTPLVAENVDVWSTYNTEKVKQNEQNTAYKFASEIDVVAAKGEEEGAQIIMTPTVDVPYFNVELSNLTHSDGMTVFPKERISVYKQLYVYVQTVYDAKWGSTSGWYPDALLPLETAVDFAENTIKANENQGLFFNFDITPEKTADGEYVYTQEGGYTYLPSGTYTGEFTLDFGTFTKKVPVSLQILDTVVSEKTHLITSFGTRRTYGSAELNFTQELKDKYTEFLYDYRISTTSVADDFTFNDAAMIYYVDKAYEMMQNPKCTLIEFPIANKNVEFYDETDGTTGTEQSFDREIFKRFIWHFINKSLETDFDMVDMLYVRLVDEPSSHNLLRRTKAACTDFKEVIAELVQEMTDYEVDSSDEELKAKLIESIAGIKNVITEQYSESYAPYIDTWCPYYTGYASKEMREMYAEQEERWIYTTTIALESSLLFPRTLSWMQAEYDITGMLNWAVELFGEEGEEGVYMPLEEYYTTVKFRYPKSNGNGYLVYPGAPYDIEGPIPSLRLESYRDGVEEYELVYELKQRYAEISATLGEAHAFTADKVVESLGSTLYEGTTVTADSAMFAQTRTSLLKLIECLNSPANMCIVDFVDDSYGNVIYKVFMKDGYTLKYNGIAVADYETVAGGKIYEITCQLSQEENELGLSFEADGKTYTYEQSLGGKATAFEYSAFENAFSKDNVSPVVEAVSASEIYPERDEALTAVNNKMLKVTLPAISGKSQRVKFMCDLINGFDANSKTLIVHIYNPSEEAIAYNIMLKKKNAQIFDTLYSTTLQPGKNVLEIPLTSVDWAKTTVEFLTMSFGGNKGAEETTIYIKDMVVYNK